MNYYYSPNTGELIQTANPAPWMDITTIAPPTFDPTTSGCFFQNGAWVIVSSVPAILVAAQVAQIAILAAAYQSAIVQQVSYTSKAGVTKTYQADANSVANVQATMAGLSAAATTPTGFYWVAADNTQVPFAYADVQGLAAVMLAQGWAAFARLQTRKASVNSATTVAAVQAIVW